MKITTYYYEKACQSEEEFRTALDVARENKVEEIIKIVEEELERGTGICAIPETTDYANGWNDGRKEAYKMRKKTLQSLIEAIKK